MNVPVVELVDVTRTFAGPPAVQALRPTSLVIEAGEYLSVTGTSGSGKSTLVNLLGLLDRPSSGSYRFCGVDTGSADDARRAAMRGRNIGVVFQGFHLLPHRTAVENVALGQLYRGTPHRRRIAAAADVLASVGLAHRADAMPPTMSGGERQRVAIARALLGRPQLLLCDEPTGNLDEASSGSVLDLVDGVHRDGIAVVVITHDTAVAGRAQRRLSVSDGRVTEAGVA